MSTTIKSRRGTTAALTASDPTPARGEIIVEYDAAVTLDADVVSVKIGDGERPWSELSPIGGGGGSMTAAEILAALLTVDGAGSGLDADLLDGLSSAEFATAAQGTKVDFLTVTQAVDLDAIETRVNSLDAAVVLRGSWDASAGTFPGGGTAQAGDSYIVSVGGTVNAIVFTANDRIVAITDNASTGTYAANWLKLDYTDQVLSVDGQTGAVSLSVTYVPQALFDANSILIATSDNTPLALTVAASRVLGRKASGDIDDMTGAETAAVLAGEVFKQAQEVNAQTGTTYTLVAADAGKLVTLANASAITLTLPQDSDATIAVGTYVDLYQLGAGQVTVAAGTGATLRTSGLTAKARAQYARLGVQKVSANTWSLFGDLAAS